MTAKLLTESNTTPLAKSGARFRAVLITPGQGSSGTYSESVLRRDAQIAFPPGTLAFADHPTEANPSRSIKDIVGVYPEGGRYEEGVGIVSELEPLPHWAPFVEAVAPHGGLSIYAMGESDLDGNITALLPDRQNSVDLVAYPGRPGSGLTQMFEAARAVDLAERTATLAGEKKETKMTPEQEALLREALTVLKSFVAESKEAAEKLAKESVDIDAVKAEAATERKNVVAALELVNEADLPAPLRKNLVSAIEDGRNDVAPLIESAKEIVTAIEDSKPRGFVLRESTPTDNTKAKSDWTTLIGGN